ncbi:MAG: HypC/HybG/HupF family hydrogenase formation chaperone [Clostridiales bacterium]|nr:HypC/HybG/HupF family hydrogenase formation chaperone [Clostridiales bacterium]
MCVAFPGKVIRVDGSVAEIDYNGNTVKANCGIVDVKEGDWALVHAGLVIQVLSAEEGGVMQQLFAELNGEVFPND